MMVDKVGDQQFLVTMWPEEYSQLQLVASYNQLNILEAMELILCVILEKMSKVPRPPVADAGNDGLRDVDGLGDSIDGDAEETPAS